MISRHLLLCCGIALSFSVPAFGASLKDVPPALLKRADCMVAAAKSVSGVDRVKLGVSDEKSVDAHERKWVRPFVEYRITDKDGLKATIRFVAHDSGNNIYDFMTILSGLSTEGSEPRDWGTNLLGDIWEAKCKEHVSVLYM
jgi:hypothetical protein